MDTRPHEEAPMTTTSMTRRDRRPGRTTRTPTGSPAHVFNKS